MTTVCLVLELEFIFFLTLGLGCLAKKFQKARTGQDESKNII